MTAAARYLAEKERIERGELESRRAEIEDFQRRTDALSELRGILESRFWRLVKEDSLHGLSRKRSRTEASLSAEIERLDAACIEAFAGQRAAESACFRRAERRARYELKELEAEMVRECAGQAYSTDTPGLVRDYGNGHVTEFGRRGTLREGLDESERKQMDMGAASWRAPEKGKGGEEDEAEQGRRNLESLRERDAALREHVIFQGVQVPLRQGRRRKNQMGMPVLIIGESGSGKTFSLKNFGAEEISIFSVEKSRLPFQKKLPLLLHATYADISKVLRENLNKKAYAVDDSQYLLVNENFDRVEETGYKKFTDMAVHFRNLVHFVNKNLPDDVVVYFLHHTETDRNTGKVKAKTVGKMLDNQLTVEGCFDIVLLAQAESDGHYFVTQSDGYSTAKSPEGMFELKIPNDLKFVDTRIREYYGL